MLVSSQKRHLLLVEAKHATFVGTECSLDDDNAVVTAVTIDGDGEPG